MNNLYCGTYASQLLLLSACVLRACVRVSQFLRGSPRPRHAKRAPAQVARSARAAGSDQREETGLRQPLAVQPAFSFVPSPNGLLTLGIPSHLSFTSFSLLRSPTRGLLFWAKYCTANVYRELHWFTGKLCSIYWNREISVMITCLLQVSKRSTGFQGRIFLF